MRSGSWRLEFATPEPTNQIYALFESTDYIYLLFALLTNLMVLFHISGRDSRDASEGGPGGVPDVTHRDAVKVISRHVGGGRGQQSPGLALVVRDEGLHPVIHQLVGQVHAGDALHLEHRRITFKMCL